MRYLRASISTMAVFAFSFFGTAHAQGLEPELGRPLTLQGAIVCQDSERADAYIQSIVNNQTSTACFVVDAQIVLVGRVSQVDMDRDGTRYRVVHYKAVMRNVPIPTIIVQSVIFVYRVPATGQGA